MSLFRDSWEVWRRKINEAIGGLVEPVKSEDVTYDNTDSGLTATNVQSAIDEVAGDVSTLETTIGDNSAGLVKDVADLKALKYKYDILWEGDASVGGNKEVPKMSDYDAVMLYYNNECVSQIIPRAFFADGHKLHVFAFASNTHYDSQIVYVDDTHITVSASQGSTTYFIGIKYNA